MSGQVIPGRVGTIMGWAGGLITGGPGIMGMCPPIGGLIPGAGPTGIIPGRGGPIIGIMGGPPYGVLASFQGEEDPGDWGEVLPRQEGEQRTEWEVSFLAEMLKCCGCLVDEALSLLLHPFLVVVFHVLFGFPATAVSLAHGQRVMGEVCIAVVTIKLGHVVLQAVGHWVPHHRK